MKELSIEEKAERYDEAIERAKKVLLDCTIDARNAVEFLHPELKESEGERIRKAIIEFIKVSKPEWENYSDYSAWISWLEKQGEQKPAWSEEDKNRFHNLIHLVEASNEGEATKNGFIAFIKRLKSLKPQPHWKPSDEQMDNK